MTARWYELPVLRDRSLVRGALSANGGNRSAAAAGLGCTAAQLKKAAEVFCIISVKELAEGTAAELQLRRMLFGEVLTGEVSGEEEVSDDAKN